MSDVADDSDGRIQAVVDEGVMACHEAAKRRELLPIGKCRYCSDAVGEGRLFCQPEVNDCAKDWAYAKERNKVNGH